MLRDGTGTGDEGFEKRRGIRGPRMDDQCGGTYEREPPGPSGKPARYERVGEAAEEDVPVGEGLLAFAVERRAGDEDEGEERAGDEQHPGEGGREAPLFER
jgi:hypothetical protein